MADYEEKGRQKMNFFKNILGLLFWGLILVLILGSPIILLFLAFAPIPIPFAIQFIMFILGLGLGAGEFVVILSMLGEEG